MNPSGKMLPKSKSEARRELAIRKEQVTHNDSMVGEYMERLAYLKDRVRILEDFLKSPSK